MNSWSFAKAWNQALENREVREPKKRDNLWASELGKAPVDLFLKLQGTPPSNPPNPRSLRKFEAGNIWEFIVELILRRSGILMDKQKWLSYQYPGLLEVTGKLDFIGGGQPDPQIAEQLLGDLKLPEVFKRGALNIVSSLAEQYPDGLAEQVLEIKSCGSYMFDIYERGGKASENHEIQLFHYLKALNMPVGHIVYVSRDDCRMLEIVVENPSPTEEKYKNTIANITEHLRSGVQPEKEKPVVFSKDVFSFQKNWRVAYSDYLTLLYGYENQKAFDDQWQPVTASWNRVYKRLVEGKERTKKNEEVVTEMKKLFPNLDELVEEGKKHKDLIPEEKEEA